MLVFAWVFNVFLLLGSLWTFAAYGQYYSETKLYWREVNESSLMVAVSNGSAANASLAGCDEAEWGKPMCMLEEWGLGLVGTWFVVEPSQILFLALLSICCTHRWMRPFHKSWELAKVRLRRRRRLGQRVGVG